MSAIITIGKQNKTFKVSNHSHDYWEVIYCTGGTGTIGQKSDFINYGKGEIILIPPRTEHSNTSDEGFTNINLGLDNVVLPFTGVVKISDNPPRHIYQCLSQCYYHFNNETNKKSDILNALSELLINYIVSFADAERFSALVELIRSEIIKGFAEKSFKVDRILEDKSYNTDYLRKLFKRETGITPLQFLTKMRINYAKKLLASRNIHRTTVTEISDLCGFCDSLYFSRIFKKYTGVPPNQYTD